MSGPDIRQRTGFRIAVLILLGGFCLASFLVAMRCGSRNLSCAEILKTLWAADDSTDYLILYHIRLPRVLLGGLVGAALALSGAILQGVMRNPLAAPGIIGVSSGGALTAVELARIESGAMDEDYARLGGLTEGEDLCEPLRASVRKRLPWLLALLALGLVVSSVVGAFEQVVSRLPLIISFQSLVLDMAGNVGTQSLAVTIRVLTDRRAGRTQKLRLLAKETRVGAANGLALAVLSVAFIGLYLVLFKGQDAALALSVAFCTSVALAVSIVLSSAAGTVIPLVFDRLHIDPAVASGPLITTVNDLIAVVTYYGLAWLLLMRAV